MPAAATAASHAVTDLRERPDMLNPMPINLMDQEAVRAGGWQAEARDADGHLISTHAPFSDDAGMIEYIKEAMEHGETVTIWPLPKT
jgi:sulfur-carrier protein